MRAVSEGGAATVGALLDDVRRHLGELDVAGLSAQEQEQVLAAVDRAGGTLTAVRGKLLTVAQQNATWRTGADRDAAAWRGRTSGIGVRTARAELRQAEAMDTLPTVARAVSDGDLSTAHLDALARAAAGAPSPAREALASASAQDELVAMARRMDAETYGKAIERKIAEHDPATVDRTHAEQRAARSFTLADTKGGTKIAGLLDRAAGHRLRLALEALTPRPTDDDERSHEQRRADALSAMADNVLESPETTPGASVRPHVSFVMTAESWQDLKHHAAARASGTLPIRAGATSAPVTLEDGTPVAATEIARALCDCELTRVVVDAQSHPVDVGRTKRLYDGPLRRAVIARDRTCSWPGCDMHARWSEIHHIRWWDRDSGETSIDNGVLLCSFHHQRTHDFHLTVSRRPVAAGEYASNGVARVRYEFRTPDGRLFAPRFAGAALGAGGHREYGTGPPPEGLAGAARPVQRSRAGPSATPAAET